MVSKEFLDFLGIKNIYFRTTGGITTIIRPEIFSTERMTVITGNEIDEHGILIIDTSDPVTSEELRIEIFVTTVKDFSMNSSYTLFFEDPFPEDFQEKLEKISTIINKTERRKECRYDIGLSNWKEFGLTRPDIMLINSTENVKCIIQNASIHGVQLLGMRSLIKIGEKVSFICEFTEKKMKLPGILINSDSASAGYFKYSLRFLEPLSLLWCNRIIEYEDFLDNMIY